MPIPKPKPSEEQQEFVSRCMGNETMLNEYPDKEQRAAVCYSTWRNRNKAIEEGMQVQAFDFARFGAKQGEVLHKRGTVCYVSFGGVDVLHIEEKELFVVEGSS